MRPATPASEPSEGLRENVHDDEEIQWVVKAHGLARFASEGVGAGAVILALSVRKPLGRFFGGTTEDALSDQRLIAYSGTFGRELSSVPLSGV